MRAEADAYTEEDESHAQSVAKHIDGSTGVDAKHNTLDQSAGNAERMEPLRQGISEDMPANIVGAPFSAEEAEHVEAVRQAPHRRRPAKWGGPT